MMVRYSAQAHTFHHVHHRIAEDRRTDQPETMVVEQGHFIQNHIDEAAFGVEVQVGQSPGEEIHHVLMQQIDGTNPDQDEQDRLQKLENTDGEKPAVVMGDYGLSRALNHYWTLHIPQDTIRRPLLRNELLIYGSSRDAITHIPPLKGLEWDFCY
jgi:hypothetical protein